MEPLCAFDTPIDMKARPTYTMQGLGLEQPEYDQFIGRAIRKIRERKPIRTALGLAKPPAPPKKTSPAVTQAERQAQADAKAKEAALQQENARLKAEVEAKADLEEQVAIARQEALDSQAGNANKMLVFGLIAIGSLAVIAGAIVIIKKRQKQGMAAQAATT